MTTAPLPPPTTAPPAAPGADESSSTGDDSGAAAGPASTDGSDADTAAETTLPGLDVGVDGDGPDEPPIGCTTRKIDFLFVITRDELAFDFQELLMDGLPQFVATIEEKFADFDVHLMVIDGDDRWGSEPCTAECPGPFDSCKVEDYPCDLLDQRTICDSTMGAGNVFNAGKEAANKPCDIAGGRRYMTRDQPDLAATFTCAGQVGVNGDQKLGEALTAAMNPALGFPGGCNEGFLRPDALLIVTFIASHYDWGLEYESSSGSAGQWADAVLTAKHDARSVIMLAFSDLDCPFNDRICHLARMFPYHLIANAWEPYPPHFDAATDMVDDICTAAPG